MDREARNAKTNAKAAANRAKGLCSCGRKPKAGYKTCIRCRRYGDDAMSRYRIYAAEHGCTLNEARVAIRTRTWIVKPSGIGDPSKCTICHKEDPPDGYKTCATCRRKSLKAYRKVKAFAKKQGVSIREATEILRKGRPGRRWFKRTPPGPAPWRVKKRKDPVPRPDPVKEKRLKRIQDTLQAIAECGGSRNKAAEKLGITRQYVSLILKAFREDAEREAERLYGEDEAR